MALLFTGGSSHRVVFPRVSADDDHEDWSVLLWVYPTSISETGRRDLFKKAHAKRLGMEDNGTYNGYLTLKQNDNASGLVQYGGEVFTAANEWYCVAGVVWATRASGQRGFIYKGSLTSALSEITYVEQVNTYGGTPETDVVDSTWNYSGDILVGNENGRFNFQRGFSGRIAMVAFWSTNLTLAELQAQQFSRRPVVQLANLRRFAVLERPGVVADLSGNGLNGYTVMS